MANAKIIAIIDHENRALRSDVDHAIFTAVAAATSPLVETIHQLEQRLKQLEQARQNAAAEYSYQTQHNH